MGCKGVCDILTFYANRRMGKKVRQKHYYAGTIFVLYIIVFVLLVSSYTTYWYKYVMQLTIGPITLSWKMWFGFEGLEMTTITGTVFTDWSSLNAQHTESLYQSIQAFVTIAIITSAAVCIGIVLRFCCKCCPEFLRTLVKWAVFVACLVTPILIFLAWALLFAQPNALNKDSTAEWNAPGSYCNDYMCKSFSGSSNSGNITWGPDVGWWLCFASLIPSIVAAIVMIRSRGSSYKEMQ